jgi:PhnB protein
MSFDVFLNFDGDCRDAIAFYEQVFDTKAQNVMTYAQAPDVDPSSADRDRILYASLPIFDHNVMMSDTPAGSPWVRGTNIFLTLGTPDRTVIDGLYARLSDGGTIHMPLGKTFFSEHYAMLTDRFGTPWQLSLTPFA